MGKVFFIMFPSNNFYNLAILIQPNSVLTSSSNLYLKREKGKYSTHD